MNTAILLAQAAEHHEKVVELPMPPLFFGIAAFCALMLLMFITMSWKGISYRH